MATLLDVARLAGVSARTVIRVLHNEPHVSVRVRNAVQDAVRTLRYTPNLMARGMVTGQTGVLALSLTSVTSLLVAPLIKGVMDRARQDGYQVVLCETGKKRAEELEYLLLARSGLVDGVILASHVIAPGMPIGLNELKAASLINYDLPGVQFPQFIQDCCGDAYVLTRHLLEQGNRQVAFLNGPSDRPSAAHKLAGFIRAHCDFGLPYRPDMVLSAEYTVEGGRTAMAALLAHHTPDAVFAGNDLIAIGALAELHSRGIRVPDDLVLCGFDDHPFSLYANPPLTTVKPDMHGLGALAVEAVIRQIAERTGVEKAPANASPRRVYLPGELVLRASTAEQRKSNTCLCTSDTAQEARALLPSCKSASCPE